MPQIVLETFTFDTLLTDPLTHAVMASDGVSLADLVETYSTADAARTSQLAFDVLTPGMGRPEAEYIARLAVGEQRLELAEFPLHRNVRVEPAQQLRRR